MKGRELAAKHGFEIGCGDNSCWFGAPGGMATNGGCRCLPRGARANNITDIEIAVMRDLVRDLATILRLVANKEVAEIGASTRISSMELMTLRRLVSATKLFASAKNPDQDLIARRELLAMLAEIEALR